VIHFERMALKALIKSHSIFSLRGRSSQEVFKLAHEVFQALNKLEVHTPALIVFEICCVLSGSPMIVNANPRRERSQELRVRYEELRVMSRSSKSRKQETIICALTALCLDAPPLSDTSRRIAVERLTLNTQTDKLTGSVEIDWSRWRCHIENQLLQCTWYRWYLMINSLADDREVGLPTLDEEVLEIISMTRDQIAKLRLSSKNGLGGDAQNFRATQGTFFEVGHHTLPSDPTRILASDLALFATQEQTTRATLLMKIADSGLAIRFGEIQRPSRRKARIRIVISLSDQMEHHRYGSRGGAPIIDTFRQSICHVIPRLFDLIQNTEIEGSIELIRDGVGHQGTSMLGIVTERSKDPPAYQSSHSTCIQLMHYCRWFFDDYFMGSLKDRTLVTPESMQELDDELLIIWYGAPPQWAQTFDPLQSIGIKLNHEYAYVVNHHRGSALIETELSSTINETEDTYKSQAIARTIIMQLDLSLDDEQRVLMSKDPWEGASL
jgi:hypothetical protein